MESDTLRNVSAGFDLWWDIYVKDISIVRQLRAAALAAWQEAQRYQAEAKAIHTVNEWYAEHGKLPDEDFDGIHTGLKKTPGPIQELQSTEEFMRLIQEQNAVLAGMKVSVDRLSKVVGWPGPANPQDNLGSQPNGEFIF